MVDSKTLIWSAPAISDLKNIYLYIAADSIKNAKKLRNTILQKPTILLNPAFENIGQIEPYNSQLRYLIEGNYKILYQILPEHILIVRVFHCSQNPIVLL